MLRKLTCLILALFSAGVTHAQTASLTDSLIALYHLNGNALDSTSNHHDGVLMGNPTLTTDRFGNANGAYLFDSLQDWIYIKPANATFKPTTFPVSICAWVRSFGDVGSAIFQNDQSENTYHGVFMGTHPTGAVNMHYGDSGPCGPGARRTKLSTPGISDSAWHMVTCVFRGAVDMDIYIDCKLVAGGYQGSGSAMVYDTSFGAIGRFDNHAFGTPLWNYYNGVIDEVRFYHRELTANDVSRLYRNSNHPFPSVSLGPDITSCIGVPLVLSPVSSTHAVKYLWSSGDTVSAIAVSGSGTFILQVSDSAGCRASDTITIVKNNAITVAATNKTICNGVTDTLTATGASTYRWSPGAGLGSTTGASVLVNPTATTTYTVTGTSALLCTGATTVVVTVTTGAFVSAAPISICSGSSGTLSGSGAGTYTWAPGAGLSATTGASVTASPTVTTTYTLTGHNGGCADTTAVAVNVSPAYVAGTLTASRDTICSGTPVIVIVAGSTSGAPGQWQSSAVAAAGPYTNFTLSGTSGTLVPAQTTWYRYIAGTGPCPDTSNVYRVVVMPAPVANYTQTAGGGLTINFNSTSSSTDVITWSWDFGDGSALNTTQNPAHTYATSGTYSVCLTVYNGSNCSFTFCKDITVVVNGVNDAAAGSGWSAFIHPSTGQLVLHPATATGAPTTVQLYNVLGQQLYATILPAATTGTVNLTLPALARGMYYVKIAAEGPAHTLPVVKM